MYYLIHDTIMPLHKEFIYLHGFSGTSKLVYRACVYTESVSSAGNASFILPLGKFTVRKRFEVQTFLWSLEFMILNKSLARRHRIKFI